MRRFTRWSVLGVAVLVIGASLWVIRRFSTPDDRPHPLTIQRTVVGRIPREMLQGIRLQPGQPTLVTDLNGDGEEELVIQLGYKREGQRHRTVSVWTDLRNRFLMVPAAIVYPRGDVPPLRELIAFSEQRATLLRLRLIENNWHAETLERPAVTLSEWSGVVFNGVPGLSLISAHTAWLDRDGDGALDTVAFALPTGRQLYLTPAPDGRWQYSRFASAPAFSDGSLHTVPFWAHNSADWGWFWCGDGDGDGAPDKLNRVTRRVRLSGGGYPLFPEPYREGEMFLHANLDGQLPEELVYLPPPAPDAELKIYRYQNGGFTLVAQKRYPGATIRAHADDLNGDGAHELLVVSQPPNRRALTLSLLRLQNQTLHETRRHLADRAFFLEGVRFRAVRRSAAFRYDTVRGFLNTRSEVRTLLTGFPPPSEQALQPSAWRIASVEGVPVWAGDYDGDGNEEYVLSHAAQGGFLAQYRENTWHIAPVQYAPSIITAAAVKHRGKPVLILVYENGVIESVTIRE